MQEKFYRVDVPRGGLLSRPLDTPDAPTVVVSGAPGATSWGYKVSAVSLTGEGLASPETLVAAGPAVLDGGGYNTLFWEPVVGAVAYRIYRTTAGGTPSSTGLIAETTERRYEDHGAAATGSEPTEDRSGDLRCMNGALDAPHADQHTATGTDPLPTVAGLTGVLATRQDADHLQGRDVLDANPADADVLSWNDGESRWEPVPIEDVQPFGSERSYSEDESISQTTTEEPNWEQKLRLTTPSLPAGTYRVSWYGELTVSAGNGRAAEVRVELDDTTELGRSFAASLTGAIGGRWTDFGGVRQLTLTAGVHTIDVDFHRWTNSGAASIRRVRVEVWRMNS